jgi:hypothetical protein
LIAAAVAIAGPAATAAARTASEAAPVTIAACDSVEAWTAHPADGVEMTLGSDAGVRGRALRIDFRFTGGGWAIARRAVDLELPDDYTLRFWLRGAAEVNTLELKLIDASGENVWWRVWRDVVWPADWRSFSARKRQIEFAWGPRGGGELRHVAAIEFAVTASEGGAGTVWIDELELVPRAAVAGPPPVPQATASSAAVPHGAALVLDGDAATFWTAKRDDPAPAITLDFQRPREYGGLIVDWLPDRYAADYTVEADEGDGDWRSLLSVEGANGGRDYLDLPESESRRVRLRWTAGGRTAAAPAAGPPAITEIAVQPWEFSATREAFFTAIAGDARRGLYPRGILGEQVYWTVAGVDADPREGLLSEDAALETGPRRFTVEPFLWTGGRLITWADAATSPSLAAGALPIPTATWRADGWSLSTTVVAIGEPYASGLLARYRVAQNGAGPRDATLFLAIRPFQVNPPTQFLNLRGGTAPIETIAREGDRVLVDGEVGVIAPVPPGGFGAATFAGGEVAAEHLVRGTLPQAMHVFDPERAASAALAYPLHLERGDTVTVDLLIPLHAAFAAPPTAAARDSAVERAVAGWRAALSRVEVAGPPAAADALATLRAQLGYILVNRAGPAIQPGARAYARSWIRDGALTGEALLRLGHAEAVRAFLEWYAPYQYADGKVPCVVDRRGADPVPEHDSTGEFIHLVTEYYRTTRDRAFLASMWPRILAGIDYLESLLAERRTDAYRAENLREFFGILPPSISHEGYSARPMHSYWDDFWALRGYRDAVYAAGVLAETDDRGSGGERARLAVRRDRLVFLRDRFASDLAASIAAAMARHDIDYVPGCADLGDFDPTSTTIALAPAAAASLLPAGTLERTFEKYWEFFRGRREGEPWEAFTPYEMRTIGAFVRLGWRERAAELLDYFLAARRPPGWRQWAEVVWRDARAPHFIGDMPHTWVGSDYIRSLLDMFVYERRGENGAPAALVLAAGLPVAWLEDGGVRIGRLPTPYGSLAYALRRESGAVVMEIGGDLAPPAGGLVLRPPAAGAAATANGRPVACGAGGEVVIHGVPARVVWRD